MLITHIDIDVIVDAYKKFKTNVFQGPFRFLDFLSNGTNIIIYGVNENTPETAKNLLTQLVQGRGEKSKPKRELQYFSIENTYINKENPYQIFFIRSTDEKHIVLDQNGFIVGDVDDYIDVFKKLSRNTYFRVSNNAIKNKFLNWQQILPKLPVTDIIISDPYLLNYSNKHSLKNNYFKLLNSLKYSYPNLDTILVFSFGDRDTDKQENEKHKSILKEIIRKSKELLGSIRFRLLPWGDIIEHDRHIFMNYNHIKFGSSLNFVFDNEDNLAVKKLSTIKIESHSDPDSHDEALSVLNDLKHIRLQANEKVNAIHDHIKDIDSKLFYQINED